MSRRAARTSLAPRADRLRPRRLVDEQRAAVLLLALSTEPSRSGRSRGRALRGLCLLAGLYTVSRSRTALRGGSSRSAFQDSSQIHPRYIPDTSKDSSQTHPRYAGRTRSRSPPRSLGERRDRVAVRRALVCILAFRLAVARELPGFTQIYEVALHAAPRPGAFLYRECMSEQPISIEAPRREERWREELARRMAAPQRHRLLQGYPMVPLMRSAAPFGDSSTNWRARRPGSGRARAGAALPDAR